APLRPSTRPSQYSSTVVPSGFSVPIPVTTTRIPLWLVLMRVSLARAARSAASLSQCLPNLTHEIGLDRLAGDPDRVLDCECVGPAVGDHRDAIDAEQGRATELSPVETGADAVDAGPDQQAAGLAPHGPRDLVAHGAEDELGGRLGHLDGHVADEPVG